MIQLYILRPNEIETARIEGEFIVAVNIKRKGKKVEYKKIPISPMLKPYIPSLRLDEMPPLKSIQMFFKKHFPERRLYDICTTFYTHCQECGVAKVARNEFVGHSLGVLGNTYTDLSDAFLLKEGKKLKW